MLDTYYIYLYKQIMTYVRNCTIHVFEIMEGSFHNINFKSNLLQATLILPVIVLCLKGHS